MRQNIDLIFTESPPWQGSGTLKIPLQCLSGAKLKGADWILQDGPEGPRLVKEGSGITTSSSGDTYMPLVAEVGPVLWALLSSERHAGFLVALPPMSHASRMLNLRVIGFDFELHVRVGFMKR
jgi:hypothetical protein